MTRKSARRAELDRLVREQGRDARRGTSPRRVKTGGGFETNRRKH